MTASRNTVSPARAGIQQAGAAGVRRHAWSYLLVRLTGLLLAVLVCGHFIVVHFANDVAATNASFIARRWSQALWVAWDWLMLATGLLHGAIGVNAALRDYASGRRRDALRAGLIALTIALFAFGSIVIARGAGT
jgi:succinate dehydrogenase / fumarate reductase, membrane anchor subunit